MPQEFVQLLENKWTAIREESAKLTNDDWAGYYASVEGITVSTRLVWTPESGFMIWAENCSRPNHGYGNYGAVRFAEGVLRLFPEVPSVNANAYRIETDFVPVKWDEQHFLIPSDRMIDFVYAVNSTSKKEIEPFLLKWDDQGKARRGLPQVPKDFIRYLSMEPITATISKIEAKDQYGQYSITLNAGRAEGVIENMTFYLSRPNSIYMKLYISDILEHYSTAIVATTTNKKNEEKEVAPKIGWRFTSRAPKDNSRYDLP